MINKKTVKIVLGGEERTFYFGLGFLGMFVENTNSTLESLETDISTNPFKTIPELMYYSLLYGYVRNDAKPAFNKFHLIEWIDEDGGLESETVLKFLDGLTNSMDSKLPKDEVKKKVRKAAKK